MLLRNNGILETSLRVRFLIFMMPILNPTLRHRWKNNVSQEHKKLGIEEAGVLIIYCYLVNCVRCLVAQLCPTLCKPMDCSPPGSSVHGDSPGKNAGVGCHALLQGLFPTQGLNPSLLHCRRILYHLSHQESPPSKLLLTNPHKAETIFKQNCFGSIVDLQCCVSFGYRAKWMLYIYIYPSLLDSFPI